MNPLISYRKQQHLSQADLGFLLCASQATVSLWEHGSPIPPDRCSIVEAITGIPCESLRPDLTWLRDEGRVTGYCKHF